MKSESNKNISAEQQTSKGCMRVTAFFVIVTTVSVIALIVLKRFLL